MKKKLSKIVFFGSGPVASKSLRLLQENFDIECVITKPSTKHEMQSIVPKTTVHVASSRLELDDLIKKIEPKTDIAVLIDFGIIVSKFVIDAFPKGIVNSHFSLLPELRGADPITFALLSGQKKTGVSMMLISEGMDDGDILAYSDEQITKNDNSSTLTDKLIETSNNQLVACLPMYIEDKIKPMNQIQAGQSIGIFEPSYSRKLKKEDGRIDWQEPAELIERKVRAFYEWPKTYTNISGKDLIIRECEVVNQQGTAGTFTYSKNELVIHCGKDAISVKLIQPAGKKEMPIKAFLAGYKL